MKNYCPDLFSGMFIEKIDENNIHLAHCCVSKKSSPTDVIDINHPDLQKSRQFFLDTGELPDDCSYCKNAEKNGGTSSRFVRHAILAEKKEFPIKIQLKKLDYNCDNICNLKCIMCGGGYSSAWREDEVKLGLRETAAIKKTKRNDLFKNVDVSHLQNLYFNGGEPLMTRDHINVLNYVIKNGDPSAIGLMYSTNGTFPLTEEILNLWDKFHSIKLLVSIDGTGPVFEYVRHPAKWDLVEKNLLDFKKLTSDKFDVSISAAVGVHNILYYDELYNWCVDHGYGNIVVQNVVGRLSTLNFPLEHKDHLLNYLNKLPESHSKNTLVSLANSIKSPSLAWVDYLNKLDNIRNNNWKVDLKKLYDLDPVKFDNTSKNVSWYELIKDED